ncbi:MAG: B3/4 domain-containing protein [Oligoflexia bacterium]|nr:B3/4 domain-containing protein [Oligoflexia bacterium]
MHITSSLNDPDFIGGFVTVIGCANRETPAALKEEISRITASRLASPRPESARSAVRDLLRRGGFSPSGRNKPANEYLANAAREGRFPVLNNIVDVCNVLSFDSGLPLCVQDLDVTGPELEVRYGKPGEKYVFNSAGQEIDLKGLICLCRRGPAESHPLSNPIKDSMEGKVKPASRNILGIVYGTRSLIDEPGMRALLERFQQLWLAHAGGAAGELVIV